MRQNLIYFFNYLDLFLYFLTIMGVVMLMILLTKILSPRNFDFEKLSVYECGFESFVTTRIKFNISFVSIAILYLIFDLEIIILLPWTLYYHYIGIIGLYLIIYFLVIILIGFFYEWALGILRWD